MTRSRRFQVFPTGRGRDGRGQRVQNRARVYSYVPPWVIRSAGLGIEWTPATVPHMLKVFAGLAPPIAFVLIGALLVEPPALSPRDRIPTLRLLADPGREAGPQPPRRDILLEPETASEPDTTDDEVERLGEPAHTGSPDRSPSADSAAPF